VAAGQQGTVSSVAVHAGRPYFTIAGGAAGGLWGQTQYLVPSGFIRGGRVRFGVLPDKIFTGVCVHHRPLQGSLSAEVEFDDLTSHGIGSGGIQGSVITDFADAGAAGLSACLKLGLTRSTGDPQAGPVVTAWELHAIPRPKRVNETVLPVILTTKVTDLRGTVTSADPLGQYRELKELAKSSRLVAFQFGDETETVRVASVAIAKGSIRAWMDNAHGTLSQWVETIVYVRLLSKEA
jgi:hypothetical protein